MSRLTHLRNALALVALSFALAFTASAESAKISNPKGLAAFDATREVTLQGTIKDVVSKPPAGTLLGLHITVATTTGAQDVHLGSYLAKNVTELDAGARKEVTDFLNALDDHEDVHRVYATIK